MELGGGSCNNNDNHTRNAVKHSLRKPRTKPLYDDNLSGDSVEEVEVDKPKLLMEKESLANLKLKDLGHQEEDIDSMSYEEKIQLIKIYEESTEMAKQYHSEDIRETNIVDVEDDDANLFSNMENIKSLRSRNVFVVKTDNPSSTATKDTLPDIENALSPDKPNQDSLNRQIPTLNLRRPPLIKLDPSIPFTKERSLKISSELAARRNSILKKTLEDDWIHRSSLETKDMEERRKIIATRLKLQSKMIFQSRLKKGRHSWVYNHIATLTEAQSVRFFKEWQAKKDNPVDKRSESPNIFDVEPMEEVEPSSSHITHLKDEDDDGNDFVDKKKKFSRLSMKNQKEKPERESVWLSKEHVDVENKNVNPKNVRKRLYHGLSSIPNPSAGSFISQTICDNEVNGKRKREKPEDDNKSIADKFDHFLKSSSPTDIESAKFVRDAPLSLEF